MSSPHGRAWSRFLSITKPFFTSEKRWQAWGGMGLLLGFIFALNGLNVANSYVSRDFFSALAERQPNRYYLFALFYIGMFAIISVVDVVYQFVQRRVSLVWRQWLTHHLVDRYLSHQAYCWIHRRNEIDNPDQRISQDVMTFTNMAISFSVTVINSTITILAFAGVLWSISPWLFVVAVLYSLFGSAMTMLLGKRLVGLNNLQLKKEADLRYELIRTREYADTIALLHGEKRESLRIGQRLRDVLKNYGIIIDVLRNVGFFTSGFKYLVSVIPVLIVAPRYLRGEIEFGVVTQAGMAFAQILDKATELIVVQFANVTEFAAVVLRLGALWDAITEAVAPAQPAIRIIEDDRQVAYEGLTLRTPKEGRLLIHDLSVEVLHGKRLLVEGPNGAGKSALFRATAGIWREGEGRIYRPHRELMMVLPQRPYTPPGSLREQLLYGLDVDEISEKQLIAALRAVKFEPILERVGGLDIEQDWSNTLSVGEQQLLAFARLFLANPPFALLDQAIGALDPQRGQNLYQHLAKTSISYISVADHVPLQPYHDTVLELHLDGEWLVKPAER
ncbi:MAG TPA: SbmA/BacA-like family transporter [Gemmataceae bacterium]|nr:SbmA/BacA-like family transporter [Gemmataceae bacterium]